MDFGVGERFRSTTRALSSSMAAIFVFTGIYWLQLSNTVRPFLLLFKHTFNAPSLYPHLKLPYSMASIPFNGRLQVYKLYNSLLSSLPRPSAPQSAQPFHPEHNRDSHITTARHAGVPGGPLWAGTRQER
jgi:hypothetical protein